MSERFYPDDELIFHSDVTDADTVVSYRGPLPDGRACVFNRKTGMQFSVLESELRKQ